MLKLPYFGALRPLFPHFLHAPVHVVMVAPNSGGNIKSQPHFLYRLSLGFLTPDVHLSSYAEIPCGDVRKPQSQENSPLQSKPERSFPLILINPLFF